MNETVPNYLTPELRHVLTSWLAHPRDINKVIHHFAPMMPEGMLDEIRETTDAGRLGDLLDYCFDNLTEETEGL